MLKLFHLFALPQKVVRTSWGPLVAALAALAVAAPAGALSAAPKLKVIGTKQRAVVRIVATDTGYSPKNIAVHAGALVTLRWTVKETGFGHGLSGRLFTIPRIESGKTGVATFRAPKKPGSAITFTVHWPDNGQMKYTVKIAVVR